MSNPVIHAFFFGRALAEVLGEKVEETVTNTLSDLGKFDAEQREKLRQFIEEVQNRAEKSADKEQVVGQEASADGRDSEDLQETLDELRAQIARLKAELKTHRNQTA